MTSTNAQALFRTVLSLVGKNVEVGTKSTGSRVSGTIVNAMFDSFLLEGAGEKRIVRFEDILFLTPRD